MRKHFEDWLNKLMIRFRFILTSFLCVAMVSSFAQSKSNIRSKKAVYEEITFEDVVRRYLGKETGSAGHVEGIYSVSCVITKHYKSFLFKRERAKTVERKDNYARVAILKDWPGSKRDFIEVSLSSRHPNYYPIVGELNFLSEERGLIYQHVEPNASVISFSMTVDSPDLMEAEYSFMKGKQTITYRMSYLKTYPKVNSFVVEKH